MVLLSRTDENGVEGPAFITFDGSSTADAVKIFFVYYNVIMRGKSPEEKAGEVRRYPEGSVFYSYHGSFSRNSILTEDAADWEIIEKTISSWFITIVRAEEHIRRAMAARLDSADLLSSLSGRETILEKAGFNNEARSGLLHNAVKKHVDVSQFATYPSPTTF